MEQIVFYLTGYAWEITAGMGALAVILLVAALHRIRRIEKYMQGIAGNTKESCRVKAKEDGCAAPVAAVTATEDGGEVVVSDLMTGVSDEAEGKQAKSTQSARAQETDGAAPQSPEQLIDEVLGEVFS